MSLNKQIETIVQELQKDLLKIKSEREQKNKQINEYDRVIRITKKEYKKVLAESKLLNSKQHQ